MTTERIAITCSDASHPSKRATVHTFVRHRDGWTSLDNGRTSQWLSDDTPADQATERPSRVRQRLRMECPLCGLSAVVRAERVYPMLDHVSAAGVSNVPLPVLVASLS